MSRRNRNGRAPLPILFLVVAAAMAQPQPQAQPTGNGSLSGVVTNSVTGAPVPRARVQVIILGSGNSQVTGAVTDEAGKFSIGGLSAGRFILNVQRVGFVTPAAGNRINDSPLRPDEKREDLKLILTPTSGISGRVINAAGDPVQGAIVSLDGAPYGVNPATTDEKGQFRISSVPPGRYRVVANPAAMPFPPEIRTDGTREVHYARTYYPNVLSAKAGQRVEVAGGAEVMGIDIHLVSTPIVTVTGSVSDMPAGTRTIVRAQSIASPSVQSVANVRPDGSFQIWQLDPGAYTVVAVTMPQASQRRLQSAPVGIEIAGADIENVALRIVQPFDVVCRLSFDDVKAAEMPTMQAPPGRPGQPAPQGAPPQPMPRRINLRPEGQTFGDPSPSLFQALEVGSDDSFTLAMMQPGRYHLMAAWGVYVKSVTVGNKETEGDLLDVSGGPAGPVTVTLASVTGELSGVVSDSNGPAPGVRVMMFPDRPGAGQQRFGITGGDGTYKFVGIPPGRYKLIAGDNDLIMQLQISRDLDEYADLAESVDIRAGDKVTKALTKQLSGGK